MLLLGLAPEGALYLASRGLGLYPEDFVIILHSRQYRSIGASAGRGGGLGFLLDDFGTY